MACGEGYGSAVLAERAARGDGRGREPRGPRARAAALPAAGPALRARPWSRSSTTARPGMRSSSCRPSSTCRSPRPCWRGSRRCSRPGGVAYVSTPNRLTLAARGRGALGQPVARARVHARGVPRAASHPAFGSVGPAGRVPRAQAARARAGAAARLGPRARGAAPHAAVLRPVRAGDQRARLRAARRRRSTARSTFSRSAGHEPRRIATAASSRSCSTPTCPTSRASAPGRSARSGCWRRSPPPTCRCSGCSSATPSRALAESPRSGSRRCWRTSSRCPSVGERFLASCATCGASATARTPPGSTRAGRHAAAAALRRLGRRLRAGGG